MSNAFNFTCPGCGNADQIDIQALVWVRVTEDGTDADHTHDGSHLWDTSSFYFCACCDS